MESFTRLADPASSCYWKSQWKYIKKSYQNMLLGKQSHCGDLILQCIDLIIRDSSTIMEILNVELIGLRIIRMRFTLLQ
jgi:hypothetical protein